MAEEQPGMAFQKKIRAFFEKIGFDNVPEPNDVLMLGGQEIDAFGRIGELYVVVDAKTKLGLTKRGKNVRSYLSIINGYKNEVIEEIKSKYQDLHGYKDTVFVFWTSNIKIEDDSKERAKELKIGLRDEFDLEYYEEAYGVLQNKGVVRNGFLKDLSFQLPEKNLFAEGHSINVNAIRTRVGSKTLFTFPIQVGNLLEFAYVFRIETNNIMGGSYQRLLKPSKIRKVRDYIDCDGGYFPNNLIAVSDDQLVFTLGKGQNEDSPYALGEICLPNKPCYIEILDGQHRLYGYSHLPNKSNSCLWVTIIQGLTPVDRAKLFVKINRTQTPVPSSILWDLYQISEPYSIRGQTSKFVYSLNEVEPFKDLIVLPRVRSLSAYLSFPNFCYSLAVRTNIFSKYGSSQSLKNVVKAYFEEIKSDSNLKIDWEKCVTSNGSKGFILTNNGISILFRLFGKVLAKTGIPENERILPWKKNLELWLITPLNLFLASEKSMIPGNLDPYADLRKKLTSEGARQEAADQIWGKSPISGELTAVEY